MEVPNLFWVLSSLPENKSGVKLTTDEKEKNMQAEKTANHQQRGMTRNLKHEVNFPFKKKKKGTAPIK